MTITDGVRMTMIASVIAVVAVLLGVLGGIA